MAKVSVATMKQRFEHCVHQRGRHLPGDLESAVRHQAMSSRMFSAEPGLEVLSIQGKYEPWRAALLKEWSSRQRRRAVEKASPAQRATSVLPVLEAAAFQMDNDPQGPWVINCGRGVSKVLGWLPLLSRLGAVKHLESVPASKRKGLRVLTLGALKGQYVWLPDGADCVLAALSLICQAGDILQEQLLIPPGTCQDWLAAFKGAEEALIALAAPGLTRTSPYVLPWTFRSMAVARMRHAGIEGLKGGASLSAADLESMFPDQADWLQRIQRHVRLVAWRNGGSASTSDITVAKLMRFMQYKGPVELFSMDLCLAGDPALAAYPPKYLSKHRTELQSTSAQYYSQHSIWPHMAVALGLLGERA